MRKIVLVASWLVLAVLASGIAWAALNSADRQVGGQAAAPVLSAAGSDVAPSTSLPVPTTDTSSLPTTASSITTPTADPTTTTSSTLPSTTVSSTTTTSAVETEWDQLSVPSSAGVVLVGHRPGEVRLDSATPAAGFGMEIEKRGPDEVRVEFEGADDSVEIRVRWKDGVLETEVDD